MTPQEELKQLLQRQESLQQELKDKRKELLDAQRRRTDILKRQIKQAQSRITAAQRKRDTRKKILVGACVLDRADKDPDSARRLRQDLDEFLDRDRDRELFGLAPRPPADDSK